MKTKRLHVPLTRIWPALALLALSACGRHPVIVMTYNVENLFDDRDDGTEYTEFDPSRGKWTADFFMARIDAIAEVVRKSAPGGPDILLLQEIENQNALKTLADSGLSGMGYTRAVLVPKRGLSTNVAVLSRLPVSRVMSFQVGSGRGEPVRDVVEVVIEKDGCTLHLLNNHWKSRTGGVKETEALRLEAAQVVARRVREILALDPGADVIVAGDMNEGVEPRKSESRAMAALLPAGTAVPAGQEESRIFLSGNPVDAGLSGSRLTLFDPWLDRTGQAAGNNGSRPEGSYYYGSAWETYDHFMMSPGLFDGKGFSLVNGSFTVFSPSFLLQGNGAPKRWNGLKGQKGYSDHLPLLIRLEIRG